MNPSHLSHPITFALFIAAPLVTLSTCSHKEVAIIRREESIQTFSYHRLDAVAVTIHKYCFYPVHIRIYVS